MEPRNIIKFLLSSRNKKEPCCLCNKIIQNDKDVYYELHLGADKIYCQFCFFKTHPEAWFREYFFPLSEKTKKNKQTMKTKNDCSVKKIIDDLENIKSSLNDCNPSSVDIITFIKKYDATIEYVKALLDKNIETLKELNIWFDPNYHFDK